MPPDHARRSPRPGGCLRAARGRRAHGLRTDIEGAAASQGHEHAGRTDIVKAHYTGWTTDGAVFDSSVIRKQPSEFR
jgi:FKBP-type peptidyl-prolyl cis-trans isomerase